MSLKHRVAALGIGRQPAVRSSMLQMVSLTRSFTWKLFSNADGSTM